MKKIFAFISLVAVAAAFAASCAKTETSVPETSTKKMVTMKCVIGETPDSKVAIDATGKTTWQAGDEILIHAKWAGGQYSSTATLKAEDISADGKSATITFEEFTTGNYQRGNTTYFASYPASAVAVDNGAKSWYSYTYYNDSNLPLMGGFNNVSDDSAGTVFYFYNLCGIVTFKVSGEFDNYEFCGNNGETVGYSNYQTNLYCTDDGTPNLGFTYGGTPQTDAAGSVEPDGSTIHYICIPGGVDLTGGFTIKFYDGVDLVKVAKSITPVNVQRNSILNLGDISSHLKDYVPPTQSDHKSEIPTAGAIDLSAAGSANSYILTAPGTYKLPALKGNSTDEAGNVFDVELVWETLNGNTEVPLNSVIDKVDFEDNWIYFQTPSTLQPGNALIAAKDNLGKIIWSWHIWIPEASISTNSYGLGGSELMNFNLGALVPAVASSTEVVDVRSLGLIYQWGRKDPFPGKQAVTSSSASLVAGKSPTVEQKQVTVNETIANPTTLYTQADGDWNSVADNNLWNNSGSKTIYDPCPPGYKVPLTSEVPNLYVSDLSAIDGWARDVDHFWFTIGDPVTVFPMGGYIDDYSSSYSIYKSEARVAIWAANGSGAKGSAVDVRPARQQLASPAKSRGGYVRCVVE